MKFELKTFQDERAYHNTAIVIFLKAVRDVLGNVNVVIGNSLNQGYFAYISSSDKMLSNSDVGKIQNRMKSIVSQDIEIVSEIMTAEQAATMWTAAGCHEKAELMQQRDPDEKVEIAVLDGYRNCMYGKILPSTGYIDLFEVRPYRRRGMLLRLPTVVGNGKIAAYRDDIKLYDAFAQSKRMRRSTGIQYLCDINRIIREGRADEVILDSEEHQNKTIHEYAKMIVDGQKRIVLIAGPSSSGKTTTAKRLCSAIAELTAEPLYMGTDDYFVDREQTPIGPDGKPDYEGLSALDMDLFNEQMEALLAGEVVDLPEFDFIDGHKKFGRRITRLEEGQILVIEGIHSLNDVLTSKISPDDKFKIYISPLTQLGVDRHNRLSTADARLMRRIVRDNQFRAYPAEKTLEAWVKVRAGESVNIFPYSSSADVVFNSSTSYETNMLRTMAEPLLLEIGEDSEQYGEAQRILNFMKYFDKIESTDAVPDNSILREFIGPRKERGE